MVDRGVGGGGVVGKLDPPNNRKPRKHVKKRTE